MVWCMPRLVWHCSMTHEGLRLKAGGDDVFRFFCC